MTMKSNNGNSIPEIDDLFEFSSEKAEDQHEARMIMFRFLSEIERFSDEKRGFKKKLAKSIKKSSSYITQLFNGDKLVNLITLAKFQKQLGIKFKITAYPTAQFDLISCPVEKMTTNIFVMYESLPEIQPQKDYVEAFRKYSEFVQIGPKSEITQS